MLVYLLEVPHFTAQSRLQVTEYNRVCGFRKAEYRAL